MRRPALRKTADVQPAATEAPAPFVPPASAKPIRLPVSGGSRTLAQVEALARKRAGEPVPDHQLSRHDRKPAKE